MFTTLTFLAVFPALLFTFLTCLDETIEGSNEDEGFSEEGRGRGQFFGFGAITIEIGQRKKKREPPFFR
jgi:hypothetical protein